MTHPPTDPPPPVPPSSAADPDGPPARAFRLGLAASDLLYTVPWCYLNAEADETWPPPRWSITAGEIGRHLDRLKPAMPEAVGTLRQAVDGLGQATRTGWGSDHHRGWVDERASLERGGILTESGAAFAAFAVAPMRPAWDALLAASVAFSAALPEGWRVLFDLGRAVGEVLTPFEQYRQTAFDPGAWVHQTLAPRVDQLLTTARRLHPGLAALPDLPSGTAAGGVFPTDGMTAAIRGLADRVPALLPAATVGVTEGVTATDPPPGAASPPAVGPPAGESAPAAAAEAPALRVPPLADGESFAALLATKNRLDPEGSFIGESLPVLRLFRQIEDLNRQSHLPVTLLGPSRSGKTLLARVVHRCSLRKDKPFLALNASELTGGDETLFREKWTGYGKNSGVGNRRPNDSAPGWLQQTAGGTIFVDELHSLDRRAVDYLRALLGRDGTPFRPATGDGEEFVPDVRLLFATFRDIDELKANGVLSVDFVRRLLGRSLTVPSLNDRREDIPLFVRQFAQGRRRDEGFLLALLQHDWGQQEVDGLIQAIQAAVSRTTEGVSLTVESLRGTLPGDRLDRFAALGETEVGGTLYRFLLDILRQQGLAAHARGRSLNVHLAELMGVDKSTIGRRLKKYRVETDETGE